MRARAGRLSPAALFDGLVQGAHVYVCGPPSLHEAVRAGATQAGVPAGRLHEERFDGGRAERAERSFEVHLRASGLRLTIAPGQTILERALQAWVFPAYDCQRGECGTCLTRVLDGEPEHRDTVQTEAEKARHRFMAICCSRARSEQIVLDL